MRNTILHGDALDCLKTVPDGFVNCCVTSPPYWGLRDYGTATWEGGDDGCDHREERGTTRGGPRSTITGGQDTSAHAGSYRDTCGKCGATRVDQQLGLEGTPEGYVAKMVEIFREVKRVLRKDGTLWLNLGDSYAGSASQGGYSEKQASNKGSWHSQPRPLADLKPKDLVGIPWRVAFALQADGWYLRSDIIWAKPNPMPESVTDRPTKAHEYIFLLSKSATYYYDAEAIAEDSIHAGETRTTTEKSLSSGQAKGLDVAPSGNGKVGSVITIKEKRNKRSVWAVQSEPYPEAHFATFPQKLIEPCIKAGCPENGIVLDPFMGSGTTALVARKLNRNYLGCELNEKYIRLAENRLHELGMFA